MTAFCRLIWTDVYLGRLLTRDMAAERFLRDDEANRLRHDACRGLCRL